MCFYNNVTNVAPIIKFCISLLAVMNLVFSHRKAHLTMLTSFHFLKNRKCVMKCSVPNVWIWLCLLTWDQFYVVYSAIYLIASCVFFVNRP